MGELKHYTQQIPGAEYHLDGTNWYYFGGTGYLGVQVLPEFRNSVARYTREIGTHWGASRAGQLEPAVYQHAESALSEWAGSESCCTLSSGFLAGRLLVEYFDQKPFLRLFSPNCHAALLPARAKRAADWEEIRLELDRLAQSASGIQPVLFTDTIDFTEGPTPLLSTLASLESSNCILVADDSHGMGILGTNGSGSYTGLRQQGFQELIVCSSLGKALGVTAGLILGSASRLNVLRQDPLFAGASPAPPAGLAALCEALESGLYNRQRDQLLDNLSYFTRQAGNLPFLSGGPEFPVFLFRDDALAGFLAKNQIIVSHFQYAAERGDAAGRLVITAAHSRSHLDRLATTLARFQDNQ